MADRTNETDLTAWWPTDGLLLRTPRLSLRPIRESDFPDLIAAIDAGIHPPERMPFGVPWTDGEPAQRTPNVLRYWWSQRAKVQPDNWHLPFVVRADDAVAGIQELMADSFPILRTVSTGSWLTSSAQGRGIGTEMRAAVLLLAFDHLGAELATTGAFVDNAASNAVSRKLGYQPNGVLPDKQRGQLGMQQLYSMRPEQLHRPDWTLQVDGLQACREVLGHRSRESSSATLAADQRNG